MAYVWVQQWVALPVIVEEQQMGDGPPDAGIGPSGRLSAADEAQLSATQFHQGSQIQSETPGTNAPFHTQFSSLPSFQQRLEPSRIPSQQGFGSLNPQSGQQQHGSPFNMSAMAGALPEYGSGTTNPTLHPSQQQQHPQRRLSGASTPAVVYQLQQTLQYPQGASNLTSPTSFGSFPQSQYGGAFGQPLGGRQQSFGPYGSGQQRVGGMQQPFPYPQLSPQQFYLAQGQQLSNYPGQGGQLPGAYPGGPGQPGLSSLDTHMPSFGEASLSGVEGQSAVHGPGSEESLSAIPRGPPRKPKQSGHALWVGNLPPGATVMDLKDHFSRDATKDIESLFLISKSNCAFVNYRTEAACAAAMQRFHDSRFQGVRLVCRLRRSSAPASGTPTGPSAMTGRRPSQASPSKSPTLEAPDEEPPPAPEQAIEDVIEAEGSGSQRVPEKFFIVKSLTFQDLEQSVRTGIWATQAHNEELLNKAYQAAENVYLIFSANKSGEYFGYARMTSPISEDAKAIYRSLSQPATTEASDAPRSIPTSATETAPKGHIIDDSARGTIFWEAEHSDEEEAEGETAFDDRPEHAQIWGKPFKVEWMSTNRLPFYRTRGLRNPWNANREVKIARDGTELEPNVGKRLVQMFHRLGPSSAGAPNMPMNLGQMPPFLGPTPTQHYPPQ